MLMARASLQRRFIVLLPVAIAALCPLILLPWLLARPAESSGLVY